MVSVASYKGYNFSSLPPFLKLGSRLSKIFHYSESQKQVFRIVKHLKEKYNYSFKRISYHLNDNNLSTVRSKTEHQPNVLFIELYDDGSFKK